MKKMLLIILSLILILSIINLINLSISEKYETQLDGLPATRIQIEEAKKIKNDIELEKKVITVVIPLTIILIFGLFFTKKNNSKTF